MQLRVVAIYGIRTPSTAVKLLIALRDRAMLLITTSMANRGEIVRSLLWSDMSMNEVPNIPAGAGKVFQVLNSALSSE